MVRFYFLTNKSCVFSSPTIDHTALSAIVALLLATFLGYCLKDASRPVTMTFEKHDYFKTSEVEVHKFMMSYVMNF